jgi:hypothetical protein
MNKLLIEPRTRMFLVLALLIPACGKVGQLAGTSCTVAMQGTAAVVEISGLSASSECESWVATGDFYRTDPQPEKDLICVVELHGLTYRVRDKGLLNVAGTSLCNSLSDQLRPPTSTPRPSCAVGVPEHDATIVVWGPRSRDTCSALVADGGFEPRSTDVDLTQQCSYDFPGRNETWVVWDSGGMYYATLICDDIEAGTQPSVDRYGEY